MNAPRSTPDHARLALGYAIAIGLSLVAGASLALGLGMQPLAGRGAGADAEGFRRLYSMHGLVMVFLVALPGIPGVLGNWMLPRDLGVAQMALPRLNRLAFQLFVGGCALFLVALCCAPADAGWSFELPFALASQARLSWSLVAMAVLVVASVCSSINLLVTVAARQRWSELSPLAWSLALSSLVQILAAPLFFVALTLVFAERAGAADILSAAPAGDVRFTAWFWSWGHPALGATLIAALGIVAEIVARHTRGPRSASRAEVTSLLAIAVLSFAAAGVHVLGRGTTESEASGTSALSLALGLPFALILAGTTRELSRGALRASPALGYALVFLVLLCVGGMAGVFLSLSPTAAQLRETCFGAAQFHYLAAGGALAALFAGLYQVWPRWFGVRVHEGWGLAGCALFFVGINLTFFPRFVLGYLGQPRRSTQILAGGENLGTLSAIGCALLLVALVIVGWNLLSSLLQPRTETQEEPA